MDHAAETVVEMSPRDVSSSCVLDDYDVDGFLRLAADFGKDEFGYVVTPNVDHLIRFHDEPAFRALYADASYVLLDSRFLSHVFRVWKGLRIRVCTGSDLTAQLFARVIAPGGLVWITVPHAPHSRAHQQIRRRSPDRAAPGHDGARRHQPFLSRLADPGEQNLARISLAKGLVQVVSNSKNFVFFHRLS